MCNHISSSMNYKQLENVKPRKISYFIAKSPSLMFLSFNSIIPEPKRFLDSRLKESSVSAKHYMEVCLKHDIYTIITFNEV